MTSHSAMRKVVRGIVFAIFPSQRRLSGTTQWWSLVAHFVGHSRSFGAAAMARRWQRGGGGSNRSTLTHRPQTPRELYARKNIRCMFQLCIASQLASSSLGQEPFPSFSFFYCSAIHSVVYISQKMVFFSQIVQHLNIDDLQRICRIIMCSWVLRLPQGWSNMSIFTNTKKIMSCLIIART